MKKALSLILAISLIFCALPVMGISAEETASDKFTVTSAKAETTTISGDDVSGYTVPVNGAGTTKILTNEKYPVKNLSFDYGYKLLTNNQGFGVFGITTKDNVDEIPDKSSSDTLVFRYWTEQNGGPNLKIQVVWGDNSVVTIGLFDFATYRPSDGYWNPNISNFQFVKVDGHWNLAVDGNVCNHSTTAHSQLEIMVGSNFFENNTDVRVFVGGYNNSGYSGTAYFKQLSSLSEDGAWESRAVDSYIHGSNEFRGQGNIDTTVHSAIPAKAETTSDGGHIVDFTGTNGYAQTANGYDLKTTKFRVMPRTTATVNKDSNNIFHYYIGFTTDPSNIQYHSVKPDDSIEFHARSVYSDGKTYGRVITNKNCLATPTEEYGADQKLCYHRTINNEGFVIDFVKALGPDGERHWYMRTSIGGDSIIVMGTSDNDAYFQFDDIIDEPVYFRMGTNNMIDINFTMECKIDVTVLDPIYQSLDFGEYSVDFEDGAFINDVAYKDGDTFDNTGDYELVYTEQGKEYRRTLALYRLGDLNTDNSVDVRDLVAMKKYFVEDRNLSLSGQKAADITLDNQMKSDDLVKLKINLLNGSDFPDTGYTSDDMENLVDFTVEVESGRDIRVLQLTDTQIIESEQQRDPARLGGVGSSQYNQWLSTKKDERYHNYVKYAIENYNPDFIIITGDLVYGEFDDNGEALLELISFMDSFKIPWAPVFGNHENESYMGVDWQCQQLENSEYCLFKQRTLTGNGNYTVGLKQDGKYKRVFFMLDSNGCSVMSDLSYANGHSKKEIGFGADQIEWYTDLAEKMRYAQPDLKFSAAFHIQLSVFAKAYAKYGFTNSDTINNPINIDAIENKNETDFGYLGRDLKGAWDTDLTVWQSLKNSGFDSIYVGHEHCNSASVVYHGVRFQYGQKSSTYDRANYIDSSGNIVGTGDTTAGTPIVGGTTIPINQDGTLGIGEFLIYETPHEPEVEIAYTETYDFNGTDFNTSKSQTGVCASNFITSLISDTSVVPAGYTDRVYGRTNCGTDGYATFSAKFTNGIDASNIVSLKVRMYVTSYTPTSGKTPLVRIFSGTAVETIVSSTTFESLGGVYDEWCEIDIWPFIKDTSLINDNTLSSFIMGFRFYTGDTTAECYYDSLTFGYSQ